MNDAVFVQKLRSVMTDNKFRRMVSHRTRGDLDQRRLWRAKAGAKNVFREEAAKKGKEYSVVLLLDESGSMYYGNRFDAARQATLTLAEAFDRTGVECAIVGFNCAVETHKRFEDKFDRNKLLRDMGDHIFDKRGNSKTSGTFVLAGGNHNYEAIALGMKMLGTRKYGKILMHITDGKPHCDYPEDCGYDISKHKTENIAKLVKAHPSVLDIGVGIMSLSVLPDIHDEVIDVRNMDDFKEQIVECLSKHIRRG